MTELSQAIEELAATASHRIASLEDRVWHLEDALRDAREGQVVNNWLTAGETICRVCGQLPDSLQHDNGCWVARIDALLGEKP